MEHQLSKENCIDLINFFFKTYQYTQKAVWCNFDDIF